MEAEKYFYTLEEVEKMVQGKKINLNDFLKNYTICNELFFCDNSGISRNGFSRKWKPEKNFKNIDDYRLSRLENSLEICAEILKSRGANDKNTSCLKEIRHMKKLILKKDFSALVFCLPGLYPRMFSFMAREGDKRIKKFHHTPNELRNKAKLLALQRKKELIEQGKSASKANGIIQSEFEGKTEYKKLFKGWGVTNWKVFLQPQKNGKNR